MIAVKITLEVLPQKKLEVMQTLVSLIKPVERERGCKSYCVSCDISDENRFYILEEWKTSKDLIRHIKSLKFGVLLGSKVLLRDPLEIQVYSVTRTQGMEAVTAARAKPVL